ncbi:UDP-N-acetylmuramoyl-tripeptide--D-alanyl-D-alanine ligase [Candidatus Pantoea edessiphila]|uniref:UDP-N-acetylmuramoyl-tripeptide--D-alanyl-D-alanine ligase n=1 Tax=Candidatus Pantoea edessiphila TaxID=2044610 RepID=A0A2P5T058_9GAMM|nr:UDP-N-acetylmuramoyl-tripeptide--D-alanyl-D-alanine ligase [Candidatus Pantoea edessiphila]PPI87974.1 UDP-N-acetylmuramoyl-tripeptide--D-alanyl-D-alanine ligase [Candidatus Pantoea edessiphila]
MIQISLSKLASITDGILYGNDIFLDKISINTRHIKSDSLFIAIIGKRFDAHIFINDAIANGAKALLVNKYLPIPIPQVVVNNTNLAFEILSSWVRNQVSTHVVALTGSSGKTTVKEMTASILRQYGDTLCNEGNFNNKFGVPMTLLRLTKQHKYAVIELGASQIGEIKYINKLVYPESVLVNNISSAHLEGFGSLANVAKAKSEIFYNLPDNGIAIINDDSNDWLNWKKILSKNKVWRFSLKNDSSDFFAYKINLQENKTNFIVRTPYGTTKVTIPLIGKHNVYNSLAASALSMSLGIPLTAISNGLKNIQALPGRLFPIYLSKNQVILDDTYNANIGSMKAAIKLLSSMPGYRVMVIGDISELGQESENLHRELGIYAKNMSIDLVISIGTFSYLVSQNSKLGEHFTNQLFLIKRLKMLLSKYVNITILIKGSRNASMEKVVQKLL